MTEPTPEPTTSQEQIDAATALLVQADQEMASNSTARATISTARGQAYAVLAVATLLAEQNALLAAPEPTPEPESTPEEPPSAELPV